MKSGALRNSGRPVVCRYCTCSSSLVQEVQLFFQFVQDFSIVCRSLYAENKNRFTQNFTALRKPIYFFPRRTSNRASFRSRIFGRGGAGRGSESL